MILCTNYDIRFHLEIPTPVYSGFYLEKFAKRNPRYIFYNSIEVLYKKQLET